MCDETIIGILTAIFTNEKGKKKNVFEIIARKSIFFKNTTRVKFGVFENNKNMLLFNIQMCFLHFESSDDYLHLAGGAVSGLKKNG